MNYYLFGRFMPPYNNTPKGGGRPSRCRLRPRQQLLDMLYSRVNNGKTRSQNLFNSATDTRNGPR